MVKYKYDAWGNCTIKDSTTNYTIAHVNPIRYRGYYYNKDTKLYYLNSRYYNPEWRRFISPDSPDYIDPETPNGLKQYALVNNLYGKAIQTAVNQGINKAFVSAAIKIVGTTIVNPFVSMGSNSVVNFIMN